MTKALHRRSGMALRINASLFQTALFGGIAWFAWPTSLEWWQFGVLSMIFGCAAFGAAIASLRLIWQAYRREKMIAEFEAIGPAPKSSRLADHDALRKAGMIE